MGEPELALTPCVVVSSEADGVCLDTGHTTLGHQWHRFLEVSSPRLSHIHANDHHGRFDDHLPPGDGLLDWAALGCDLQQVKFDRWIILELRCPDHRSLEDHFPRPWQQLVSRLP
jgi:sugar phosphate isomerase/epimerase